MTDSSLPIDVREITKRYDQFLAVDGISFAVRPGTVFGLLGPNGAGKTTTIRMIMNIIVPDSGSVSIFGKSGRDVAARSIGYLPEERGLYRKMRVLDHLGFLGEIRGLSRQVARNRAADWLERLGLSSWQRKKVEELSKGMQQKLQFVGCVIHDPDILILDEPFSGLDPVNTRVFKELLLELRDKGKTLVLSTHVMEQAERLCDEIALIHRAKIVLRGPLTDIKKRFSGNRMLVRGRGDAERLRALPSVQDLKQENGQIDLSLRADASPAEFVRQSSAVFEIESVIPHEASLDEIFIDVVGGVSAPAPMEETS
ncbi:MAG: ATP-binding cassette domain-containing protein [Acidobacteriota bacterium]